MILYLPGFLTPLKAALAIAFLLSFVVFESTVCVPRFSTNLTLPVALRPKCDLTLALPVARFFSLSCSPQRLPSWSCPC